MICFAYLFKWHNNQFLRFLKDFRHSPKKSGQGISEKCATMGQKSRHFPTFASGVQWPEATASLRALFGKASCTFVRTKVTCPPRTRRKTGQDPLQNASGIGNWKNLQISNFIIIQSLTYMDFIHFYIIDGFNRFLISDFRPLN